MGLTRKEHMQPTENQASALRKEDLKERAEIKGEQQ